jgi:hypothetical protein
MKRSDQELAVELESRAETYRRIASGMKDEGERAQMLAIADGYAAEAARLREVTPRSARRP